MRPRRRIALVLPATLAALALLLAAATIAQAGGRSHTYKPPFKKGAQGGDQYNYTSADPSSGQETIVRAYPQYNPFTCGGSRGGYVSLRMPLKVAAPIASVEVDYDNALVDPYSFLTVTVKRGNVYIGSKDVRGPLSGSGKIVVPIDLGSAPRGSTIVVDFGLEVPSACPNVEVAEAQFQQVVVHDA